MKILLINATKNPFERYLLCGVNKELLLKKYKANFKEVSEKLLEMSFIKYLDDCNSKSEDEVLDVLNYTSDCNLKDISEYSLVFCIHDKNIDHIKKELTKAFYFSNVLFNDTVCYVIPFINYYLSIYKLPLIKYYTFI